MMKQVKDIAFYFVVMRLLGQFGDVIRLDMTFYAGLLKSVDAKTFRPYPYVTDVDFLFLCLQCVWGIVIVGISVKQV